MLCNVEGIFVMKLQPYFGPRYNVFIPKKNYIRYNVLGARRFNLNLKKQNVGLTNDEDLELSVIKALMAIDDDIWVRGKF